MDIHFDCCPYSKEDAQEALNRLVNIFKIKKVKIILDLMI